MNMTATAPAGEDVRAGFARRAEALHVHGASDEALRLLSAGVLRFPADVTARLVLSRVCADTGRAHEARDWLEAALRLDPECPAALKSLAARASTQEPQAPTEVPEAVIPAPKAEPAEAPEADLPTPVPAPSAPRPKAASTPVRSFAFPVREEEEDAEIEEISAPHVATATLAEIYLQQGLKEQAAMIFRQLLEQHPGDDAVRRRLQEIEGTGTM